LPNGNQIKFCEYGEYPQKAVREAIAERLESNFKAGSLHKSGKNYTFDNEKKLDSERPFSPKTYEEYVSADKKYVRVEGLPYDGDSVFSDGRSLQKGKAYWFEVQPIEWLVDKSGVWVAKKALFAGMPFDDKENYDGNFSKTAIKSYLDKYFSAEMQSTRTAEHIVTKNEEKTAEPTSRQKKYGIKVEEDIMPVKDQISFYVEHGMSFMLHGSSGVGKTARVEAIDPNLTAVPLWNGVLPEDIVGKVRYLSGETALPYEGKENEEGGVWVPPDWYVELCKKCEAEPNKQHVLFIDEVTNARPTTQSLIFHIVLKKSISPSKGKLPKNCVVALAGNSKEESGAAYNMPEPLFRRMCGHIHLEANVPEWLEWASEKSCKHPEDKERLNIHPLVSSFVGTHGSQVFYSSYDEEDPKDWAIDPRGWEQISDIIYDNKGVIRRELLEAKMGRELAASFLAYAKNPPLMPEEILAGEYTDADIPTNSDARLALTLSLRYVSSREVGKARKFIKENLGNENEAIFDSVWIGKDDERALQIAQIKNMER